MPKRLSGIQQLAPIPTANLHQQVYHQMRKAIMVGKFRPGEILTLRGLAAALGTRIMPARDAVLRLTVERALESFSRGVRIPTIDLLQLNDIFRLRTALEGEAVASAAQRATPLELTAIRQAGALVIKARNTETMGQFLIAEQAFHFSIYRAAHSALLQALIETLWLQIGPVLGLLRDSEQGQDPKSIGLVAHDRLVDSLLAGDSDAARAAVTKDLRDGAAICRPLVKASEQGTSGAPVL